MPRTRHLEILDLPLPKWTPTVQTVVRDRKILVLDPEQCDAPTLNIHDLGAAINNLGQIRHFELTHTGTRRLVLPDYIVCPPRTAIGCSLFVNGLVSRVYWVSQSSSARI